MRQRRLLTDACPTIRVESVLLVAAAHGARVRVLAAVLAASVSIVTGDYSGPKRTHVCTNRTTRTVSF